MSKRDRIEKLLEIYLNDLESTTREAGWHGDSTLAMMIDYRGDLPGRSGNDRSNAKMLHEIQYLRGDHALLPTAKLLFGRPVGSGILKRHHVVPMLAARFYRGKCHAEIAALIGMEETRFKNMLAKGRALLGLWLEKFDTCGVRIA